jgi:hypothetical protein
MATEMLERVDRQSGLRLFSQAVSEPSGRVHLQYRFDAETELPAHLAPPDPGDRVAAYHAFEAMGAWLKAAPPSH